MPFADFGMPYPRGMSGLLLRGSTVVMPTTIAPTTDNSAAPAAVPGEHDP
jgi:hypothetical protein